MIDDGGPAFPQGAEWGGSHPVPGGMSLRDFFAAATMTGLLASPRTHLNELEEFSKRSYEVADAMLKERNQTDATPPVQ